MKKINFKVLLLITLLGGLCFKASATQGNSLVEYKRPITNNDATTNKEIVKHKENNGVLTTTREEISKDQGKVYNLVIKSINADTSVCEEKIYLEYILKILEKEFNTTYNTNIENIFKNLNVEKNNGYVYVNFEVTIPIQEDISTKISEFVAHTFVLNETTKTKENLKTIINKHDLGEIKTNKNEIIEKELKKLKNYTEEIENEYKDQRLFSNPMQDFFGMNNIFSGMEKMFNNSFFTNNFFKPYNGNELDEIKEEVKKEEREKEKNDIEKKINEKKLRLMDLMGKGTEKEKLNNLINNIESFDSNGNYYKTSKSFSSVSKN